MVQESKPAERCGSPQGKRPQSHRRVLHHRRFGSGSNPCSVQRILGSTSGNDIRRRELTTNHALKTPSVPLWKIICHPILFLCTRRVRFGKYTRVSFGERRRAW